MPRRNSPRSDNMRRALAQEAARLMAEHGIQDFLAAKRKAAARFGNVDSAALPGNAEIEAALAEYQRLFTADTHGTHLHRQRLAALKAMQCLAEYQPRLVGPVLVGTATEHADVQLHLFADQPESVGLQLLDRGIAHEITGRRLRVNGDQARQFPGLRFAIDTQPIEATIFPVNGIRQAPASPVDGRPMRRADIAELRSLLGD